MSVPPIFASQILAVKFSALAGQSLLVYDYLLTLPLEVSYFWDAPWTLVKALFLINRYGTLLGQIVITVEEMGYLSHGSQEICYGFNFYIIIFTILSSESIRLLVLIRACAILRCRRSLAVFLQMLYVLYAVGLLMAVLYLNSLGAHPHYQYLMETGLCFSPVPPNGWTFWPVLAFLDCFVLGIVCYNLWRLSIGPHGPYPLRLIRLLARDAIMFYFAALFGILIGILSWTIDGQNPIELIQSLIAIPFLSVVGQRVVLNLRAFRAQPDSTRDLSREVDRQIAAMVDETSLEVVNNESIQMADLRLDHEGQSHAERGIP